MVQPNPHFCIITTYNFTWSWFLTFFAIIANSATGIDCLYNFFLTLANGKTRLASNEEGGKKEKLLFAKLLQIPNNINGLNNLHRCMYWFTEREWPKFFPQKQEKKEKHYHSVSGQMNLQIK